MLILSTRRGTISGLNCICIQIRCIPFSNAFCYSYLEACYIYCRDIYPCQYHSYKKTMYMFIDEILMFYMLVYIYQFITGHSLTFLFYIKVHAIKQHITYDSHRDIHIYHMRTWDQNGKVNNTVSDKSNYKICTVKPQDCINRISCQQNQNNVLYS